MQIEIHGVHLDKENKLTVTYKKTEVNSSAPISEGPATGIVHPDLIDAMGRLSVHLAAMTGQINLDDIKDIETPEHKLLQAFSAKSFSMSGEAGKEAIIISGNRKLNDKKVFNFNTPRYLLHAKEDAR